MSVESAVLERNAAPQPGKWSSLALAAAVHLVLGLILFFGIRWQTQPSSTVEVEVVRSLPPPAATQPVPKPVPVPPKPKVEAPPPPPPPKVQPKPDIAMKEPVKPKPPKVEPKPVPKPPQPDPKELEKQRRLQDQERLDELLAQESERLRTEERRSRQAEQVLSAADLEAAQLAQQRSAQASRARDNATRNWTDRIRGRVRGNIVRPPGIVGNPEAVFVVTLLPDGSLVDVQLKKSSGNATLDAAIERAIHKSDPLPKPDDPAVFTRVLELKFRPYEDQ